MAYDETFAAALRARLEGHPEISEKRMFGGLCFLLRGNMVCGVHRGGAMFRVGKANEAAALAMEGVRRMTFTGRLMGGMVDAGEDAVADPDRLGRLMALALDFVGPQRAK